MSRPDSRRRDRPAHAASASRRLAATWPPRTCQGSELGHARKCQGSELGHRCGGSAATGWRPRLPPHQLRRRLAVAVLPREITGGKSPLPAGFPRAMDSGAGRARSERRGLAEPGCARRARTGDRARARGAVPAGDVRAGRPRAAPPRRHGTPPRRSGRRGATTRSAPSRAGARAEVWRRGRRTAGRQAGFADRGPRRHAPRSGRSVNRRRRGGSVGGASAQAVRSAAISSKAATNASQSSKECVIESVHSSSRPGVMKMPRFML